MKESCIYLEYVDVTDYLALDLSFRAQVLATQLEKVLLLSGILTPAY